MQAVVYSDAAAIALAHLRTYRRIHRRSIALVRQHLKAISGEIEQRSAVIVEQRMIKTIDKALPLFGSCRVPVTPQHQPSRVAGIEMRQQNSVDQRIDLGGILAVLSPVRIELAQHGLRRRFNQLARITVDHAHRRHRIACQGGLSCGYDHQRHHGPHGHCQPGRRSSTIALHHYPSCRQCQQRVYSPSFRAPTPTG